MSKRAALYLRVSTGEKTIGNQRIDLERVVSKSGWSIAAIYEDTVSGARTSLFSREVRTEPRRLRKPEISGQ